MCVSVHVCIGVCVREFEGGEKGSLATVKIDTAWLARIMKHVPVLHAHTYFSSKLPLLNC